MTKVSITGSMSNLQKVIESLHELEILHIDDYSGEELETGDPFEEAEELSEMLVDVRSLRSKLPEVSRGEELDLEELENNIEKIKQDVSRHEDRKEQLQKKLGAVEDRIEFFRKIEGTGLEVEDLEGSDSLEVFVGEFDEEKFRDSIETDNYDILTGREASIIFYYREDSEEVDEALSGTEVSEIEPVETELAGRIGEVLDQLEQKRDEAREELESVETEVRGIAEEWYPQLDSAERFLREKVEKAEAPLRFATTGRTFIAEGYVPEKEFHGIREELIDITDGSIHIQQEEPENPPVKHENNSFVQPFESLTDLVAIPRYNELDPSFMIFLTFPIMFGFMIGDAGYGLTSLAVFYAAYKKIPAARDIFKSLMYASFATILFGLVFGDAFGFLLFGENSRLAALTGIEFFRQVPFYHRSRHFVQVFNIAALFGVLHINIGYLLGAYNEYVNHSLKEAFLEKGSWLLLEIGAVLWYFSGAMAGAPVILIAVAMLYLGEGIEGVVEIPSLLSNILSYLRIFGVAVAAVSLAAVVDSIAAKAFGSGGVTGIILGFLILIVGHTFNTFVKIMEGFLQGIRLHYVELFTKFFDGGGRKYSPFGG